MDDDGGPGAKDDRLQNADKEAASQTVHQPLMSASTVNSAMLDAFVRISDSEVAQMRRGTPNTGETSPTSRSPPSTSRWTHLFRTTRPRSQACIASCPDAAWTRLQMGEPTFDLRLRQAYNGQNARGSGVQSLPIRPARHDPELGISRSPCHGT